MDSALVCLCCHNKITDEIIYKEQKIIFYGSGGWEAQRHGLGIWSLVKVSLLYSPMIEGKERQRKGRNGMSSHGRKGEVNRTIFSRPFIKGLIHAK